MQSLQPPVWFNCRPEGPALLPSHLCSYCKGCLPILEDTQHYAPYRYEAPFTRIIHQLKFGGKIAYAKLLGQLLTEFLLNKYKNKSLPEVLIPVPLHLSRQRKRGYNQSTEIAREVARGLNIQVNTSSCKRVRNTLAQATLSREERLRNLDRAFECNPLDAEHVAILDDVVTTGATVKALSNTLYKSGAGLVEVWSICRGTN